MRRFLAVILVVTSAGLLTAANATTACPFCSAPSLTLAEQVAESDAVVLVRWVDGKKATEQKAGSTTYEVMDVTRNAKDPVTKGRKITLTRYRAGEETDLFVLMGTEGKTIEWGSPIEVSDAGYKYMTDAPDREMETARRLEYFVNYLEHPDQLVSNDAYAEFANAPYEDIAMIADKLPTKKVRQWITSNDTSQTRLGLYGLLLGLGGDASDAKVMETKITEPADDFRLGIDGIMSGYLLLNGAKGLDTIDRTKLKPAKVKNKKGEMVEVPFSEIYSAMQALRFMWTYGNNRVPKERLRQSMRLLLDRPELADLVIADLARWKDWSIQEDLMAMYDNEAYSIPSIKRAIIKYMYQCSVDLPKGKDGKPTGEKPAHAVSAAKYLKVLEKKDPKRVRDAMRYMLD